MKSSFDMQAACSFHKEHLSYDEDPLPFTKLYKTHIHITNQVDHV